MELELSGLSSKQTDYVAQAGLRLMTTILLQPPWADMTSERHHIGLPAFEQALEDLFKGPCMF